MGANCCAANNDDDTVDVDQARKDHADKKKRKSQRISERKKKGTEVPPPQADTYDENDPETLIPQAPSLLDCHNHKTHHGYLTDSRAKAIEYWYEVQRDDWKFVESKEEVDLYTLPADNDDQYYIKRVIIVNKPVKEVFEVFKDIDKLNESYGSSDSRKFVSDVEGVSEVVQLNMKGNMLFGNRDFVYCKTGYLLKNGHYLIINHSVPNDEIKTKGSIRGIFEEIILLSPDGEKKTVVHNVQKVDMKGNIPPSVLKTLMKRKMEEYVSFRKYNNGK